MTLADAEIPAPSRDEVEVVRELGRLRILPLATLTVRMAQPVGRALVAAELPCLEIAFRNPEAAAAVRAARQVPGLLVGAGTVLSVKQACVAAGAGAQFAVAPGTNEQVIGACRELGLPFFPGVATPSEIDRAYRLGLRTMKVFPVSVLGGPSFLRAVSATYPEVRFIPTGGIGQETIADYLALPQVLACGGSWIVDPDVLARGAFAEVERRARQAMELRP